MPLTKDQFIQWAESKGWTKDKFGHLQKKTKEGTLRFKIQANSVRYEHKLDSGDETMRWVRIRSGYFKDLSITDDGKLAGLK